MINVNRILKKENPTGKDVGRLFATTLLNLIHGETKPLITTDQLTEILTKLQTEEDLNIVKGYQQMVTWFRLIYSMAGRRETEFYQVYNGIDKTLSDLVASEDIEQNLRKLNQQLEQVKINISCDDELTKKDILNSFNDPEDTVAKIRISVKENLNTFDSIVKNEEEDYTAKIVRILYKNFCYFSAFNQMLDLISEMYKLDLSMFKFPMEKFKDFLEVAEYQINLLKKTVSESSQDLQTKQQKLNLIDQWFPPFDPEQLNIPDRLIKLSKKNLRGFKVFYEKAENPMLTFGFNLYSSQS